jgi:hypothetical protein
MNHYDKKNIEQELPPSGQTFIEQIISIIENNSGMYRGEIAISMIKTNIEPSRIAKVEVVLIYEGNEVSIKSIDKEFKRPY